MNPSKSLSENLPLSAIDLIDNLVESWTDKTQVEIIGRQLQNIIGKDDRQTLAFLKNNEAVENYISVHFKIVLKYEFRNIFDKLFLSLFSACARLMQTTSYLFRFMNNPQTCKQVCKLWELMLRKNLTQFMKTQLSIREMVGHDVSYRLSTPKQSPLESAANEKIKLYIEYLSVGSLTSEMSCLVLKDCLASVVGNDKLKTTFCTEDGLCTICGLICDTNNETESDDDVDDKLYNCCSIVSSVLELLTEHPTMVSDDHMICVCKTVLPLLQWDDMTVKVIEVVINILLKVLKLSRTLAKHLVEDLNGRLFVEACSAKYEYHIEVYQLCATFLLLSSPRHLESVTFEENCEPIATWKRERPRVRSKSKGKERRETIRDRTVRPPTRRSHSTSSDRLNPFRSDSKSEKH